LSLAPAKKEKLKRDENVTLADQCLTVSVAHDKAGFQFRLEAAPSLLLPHNRKRTTKAAADAPAKTTDPIVDRIQRNIAKYAGLSRQVTIRTGSKWDCR
jgi:hypothetical protein